MIVQVVMAPVAVLYCLPTKLRMVVILILALLVTPNMGINLVHVSPLASPEVLTAACVLSIVVWVFLSNICSAFFVRIEDNFDSWPWSPGDVPVGDRQTAKRTKKMEVRAAPCPFTGKQ